MWREVAERKVGQEKKEHQIRAFHGLMMRGKRKSELGKEYFLFHVITVQVAKITFISAQASATTVFIISAMLQVPLSQEDILCSRPLAFNIHDTDRLSCLYHVQ